MLPPFDQRGNLAPGVYETNWTEFRERFGFNSHRKSILVGLKLALQLLAQANCQRVYIGGTCVTNKQYPNYFDGCYDDMTIDDDLLDPIFDEELVNQQERFGGQLFADPIFQAFCRPTKRDGNPRELLKLRGNRNDSKRTSI